MKTSSHRIGLVLLGALLIVLGLEIIYFCTLISCTRTAPNANFDLVVTYSDSNPMEPALELANSQHKPLYVSQAPWESKPFLKYPPADLALVEIDPNAATTDQNARHAVAFIRQGGYQRVVLDVDWFHLPRALLLTRLYLMGSGVAVIPCVKTPLPDQWWTKRLFQIELFKFWGSIGRVILAFLGWQTGPTGPRL
jgi:hypothetical protein